MGSARRVNDKNYFRIANKITVLFFGVRDGNKADCLMWSTDKGTNPFPVRRMTVSLPRRSASTVAKR